MARTSTVRIFLLLGMLVQTSLVFAQQPPSSAPPKLERLEDGSDNPDNPITLTPQQQQQRRSAAKITETREGGRTTEVQVTTGKSSYTMKANPPGAVSQPGDGSSSTLRPPQWKVLEFDFGTKKHKEPDEAASATADAPPPPMPSTR